MKRFWLAAIFVLAACGGTSSNGKTASVRVIRPGALMSGPAGGSERDMPVSGRV